MPLDFRDTTNYSQHMLGSSRQKKNKITHLVQSGTYDQNKLSEEKRNYVSDVVNVPQFDPAFEFVSRNTMKFGSLEDRESIQRISNKRRCGQLDFEDLCKLDDIGERVYKYAFAIPPEADERDMMIVWGGILTAAAIVMRIAYSVFDVGTIGSKMMLLFLIFINYIAFSYTVLSWPEQILCNLEAWLKLNIAQKSIVENMLKKIRKRLRGIVLVLISIPFIWLAISYFLLGNISMGNDVLSIVSLFISVFCTKIIRYFTVRYENHIYRNGRK